MLVIYTNNIIKTGLINITPIFCPDDSSFILVNKSLNDLNINLIALDNYLNDWTMYYLTYNMNKAEKKIETQ